MYELKIISAYERGRITSEYLLIEVLRDTNLHNYIVFDSTYNEFHPASSEFHRTYWFPYCEVREGDYIYLYSGQGENRKSYDNALDYTEYLFYWGRKDAAWIKGSETAYVFRLNLPPQICNIERSLEPEVRKLA